MKRTRLRRAPFFLAVLGAVTLAVVLPRIADAAITAPAAPPGPVASKGIINIKDNVRNPTRPGCTNASSVYGGLTKFTIDKAGVPVATFDAPNDATSSGFTVISSASIFWATNGATPVERGIYTVTPTYFNRAAGQNCFHIPQPACGANGAYYTFSSTTQVCPDAAAVGGSQGLAAGAPLQIDVENESKVAFVSPPTTWDTSSFPDLVVTANLKDKNNSFSSCPSIPCAGNGSASSGAPAQATRALAGRTVDVTLSGNPTTYSGVTTANGDVQFTIPTAGLALGSHTLTATFAADPYFLGSTASSDVKLGGGTTTTYSGATEVYWNEDFTASAVVAGVPSGTPDDGTVDFAYGAQHSPATPNQPAIDDNGLATWTFHANDIPGPALTAHYNGSSDQVFLPSDLPGAKTQAITVKQRMTSLSVGGTDAGKYGDDMTVFADLTDITPISTQTGPLAGRTISFQIGTHPPITAVTNDLGHASATLPAFNDVGSVPIVASYAGDARYTAASASKTFASGFRYTFKDDATPTFFDMNPGSLQFGYRSPTLSTGTLKQPLMFSLFLPKNLAFALPPLPTIPANLLQAMLGAAPGNSTPIINAKVGTPLNGGTSRDPANNAIPIGGFTLGDLVNKISTGHYPTDLDTCQVLTKSTCERRLVVLTHSQSNFNVPVGIFDVKTGLFVALESDAAPHLLMSFGSCLTDVLGCIGYPYGLSGLPLPPLPPLTIPTPPSVP